MHHDERALAEIIDGKGNKHEIPGTDDRFTAEMAHIGIEGFPAGSAEDDRGEDEKTCQPVMEQVTDPEEGAECKEDPGGGDKGDQPGPGQCNKPEDHDRPEGPGHTLRTPGLQRKETDGDDGGDGHEDDLGGILKPGYEKDPLDRGEDVDRRGDDTVTDKEGDPDYRQQGDERCLVSRLQQGEEDLLEHDGTPFTFLAELHRKVR